MKGLIYKDWVMRKKAMLIFAALYSLPFFILFGIIKEDINSHFVYVFSPIVAGWMLILDTFKNEKEGEQDFLMSLPVTRDQVVSAKFLSLGLYTIFGLIPALALGMLLKIPVFGLRLEYPSALDFFKILTGVLLLTWILPLYFRFGFKMIKTLLVVLMSLGVLLQVGLMAALSFERKGSAVIIDTVIAWFRSVPAGTRRACFFITALLVAGVSYLVSRLIYGKKNF